MDAKWYWENNPGHFDLLEENAFEMMGFAPQILLSPPSFDRPLESGSAQNENELPAAIKSARIRSTRRLVNPIKQTELDVSALSTLPFVSGSRNFWVSWTKGFLLPADETKRDSIEKVRSLGTDKTIWQNLPIDMISPSWSAPTETSSAGSVVTAAALDDHYVQLAGLYRLSSALRAATSISARTSKLAWPQVDFRLDADTPATSANLFFSSSNNSMLASFMRRISSTLAVGSQIGLQGPSFRACVGARLRSCPPRPDGAVAMKEVTLRLDSDGLVRGTAVSQTIVPFLRSSVRVGAVAEAHIIENNGVTGGSKSNSSASPKFIGSVELTATANSSSLGKIPLFIKMSACNQYGITITAASRLFNRYGIAVHLMQPRLTGASLSESSATSGTLPPASPTIKFALEL